MQNVRHGVVASSTTVHEYRVQRSHALRVGYKNYKESRSLDRIPKKRTNRTPNVSECVSTRHERHGWMSEAKRAGKLSLPCGARAHIAASPSRRIGRLQQTALSNA